MNDSKRLKRAGVVALLLGLAATGFICLLTAIHAVGTDDGLYHRLQMKAWEAIDAANPVGLSDDDLRMLDAALADYLAGDIHALEEPTTDVYMVRRVAVFGETQPAFNEKEMTHLRDCHNLFALLRKVRSRLTPWAVLLVVGGAYLLRDRRRVRRVAWLSPLAILLPLGAFVAWAAIDFNSAFNAFHRVLFTNDLWLLDPRTDLLIRICPQSMFMAMGLRIGLWSLAALVGIPAIVTALTFIWPKGKGEENTWNNRDTRRASGQKQMPFGRGAGR